MKNSMIVLNSDGEKMEIELLLNFKVDSIGKEYVAYTINDDGVSDYLSVIISEVTYENGILTVVPIKDDEKEMVLMFYNQLRNAN